MLRLAVVLLMIPTVCDPPPQEPPYTCRTLPAEVDFGEAQTFSRSTRFFNLDSRDRPELGTLSGPFAVHTTSMPAFSLAFDFTPLDAQLHFDSVTARLSPECEPQTVRLVGRGSGALETPSRDLDLGALKRFQPIELTIPLINTRREPISVSASAFDNPRVSLEPDTFSLQPFEHRVVTLRMTCVQLEGASIDLMLLSTRNQTLTLVITSSCVP